jgi:CBS domain-containing protein
VLDHEELVGMVSIGDVVLARLEEQARDVDDLKAYVAGNM